MQFTLTRAAAALALAFGILASTTTHAVQPQPFEGAADNIRPAWTPLGVSQKPVTVVVKLALQLASVVAVVEPRKVCPSPKPLGSRAALPKNSMRKLVLVR